MRASIIKGRTAGRAGPGHYEYRTSTTVHMCKDFLQRIFVEIIGETHNIAYGIVAYSFIIRIQLMRFSEIPTVCE